MRFVRIEVKGSDSERRGGQTIKAEGRKEARKEEGGSRVICPRHCKEEEERV